MVRGPASGKTVCLTFDDGPHPEHTPRLLDVLARHGAKGTFFMVGQEAERWPALVERVAAEGHAVGGHSWTHGDPGSTGACELAEEVERTEQLFERLLGRRSKLFRPPHGKLTAGKMLKLLRGGQRVVLWNVDPKDFACGGPRELEAKLRPEDLRGGDVVLLHDNHPYAGEVLPGVIPAAARNGIRFGTIAEWIA